MEPALFAYTIAYALTWVTIGGKTFALMPHPRCMFWCEDETSTSNYAQGNVIKRQERNGDREGATDTYPPSLPVAVGATLQIQ